MSNGDFIKIGSKQDFDLFTKQDGMTLIHFLASWSPSSTELKKGFEELLKEYPNTFKVASVEAESLPEVSLEHNISAVPTVLLFKNGSVVDRSDSADVSALRNLIVKHTFDDGPASVTTTVVASKNEEGLEDRLKKLINKSRLTLFMKGNPSHPRCGFSRQITQLLDSMKADYWTFDILSDEEVRQGLKTYSDWPTYPQLYLDGEFLGGLDVVREEMKDPEFVAKLPKLS